jgi:cytochrome oxidase assembly protein ShyY1
VIPVTTLFLGIWQVYRWRWKLGVINEMEKVVHSSPIDFPVGE